MRHFSVKQRGQVRETGMKEGVHGGIRLPNSNAIHKEKNDPQ
jgi:hypothetical protein